MRAKTRMVIVFGPSLRPVSSGRVRFGTSRQSDWVEEELGARSTSMPLRFWCRWMVDV
ncbi:MAG: hypothetical protein ACNA8W_07985 [Bradymonadaceae bacterium]